MSNKLKFIYIGLFCLAALMACEKRERIGSDLIDVVQSHYLSLEINDKKVEWSSDQQYLMNDFIPRLGSLTLKSYEGEMPTNYSYKVTHEYEDKTYLTLLDSDYLIINDDRYEVVEGSIDLNRFYQLID